MALPAEIGYLLTEFFLMGLFGLLRQMKASCHFAYNPCFVLIFLFTYLDTLNNMSNPSLDRMVHFWKSVIQCKVKQ